MSKWGTHSLQYPESNKILGLLFGGGSGGGGVEVELKR